MNKKKIKNKIKQILPHKRVNKVSLFIVGAQKAGTSALHNYLIKHPQIQGGAKKELNFFNHPELYKKGLNWYHKQYKTVLFYQSNPINIDATPQYLDGTGIAQKIYDYNPAAKIVILIREPASRAYSAWNMYRQFAELSEEDKKTLVDRHISKDNVDKFRTLISQNPFPSFDEFVEEVLEDNNWMNSYPNIIKKGIYIDQIETYINVFGREKVLIFESDYFKNNKIETTNEVIEFIGLSPFKNDKLKLKEVHSRDYESPISATTNKRLRDFYKPHNERLFKLINQKFDW